MGTLLKLLTILFIFLTACNKVSVVRSLHVHNKADDGSSASVVKASDRPSDSSGSVPGYLTLGCTISSSDDGVDSSCVLANRSDKVDLPALATSWTWHYELERNEVEQPTVTVLELPQDNPFHVRYRFSGLNRDLLLKLATQSKYYISMQAKGASGIEVIGETSTKKTAFVPLTAPRYRYVRIVFPSLKQPWSSASHLDIEGLELKWDGQWRQGTFSNFTGTLGPYEVTVSASSYDSRFNGFPYYAFRKGPNGDIWETIGNTYSNNGTFDALGDPQWLKLDFKSNSVAIQGIKIDGGDSRDAMGSEGSPDSFYLEGSQDNTNWTVIEGSRHENVDTTVMTAFEWAPPRSPQ
jgi:hypothetical protein